MPTRLPRSLHESPAYDPQWRHLQVLEYLRCRRHHGEQECTFILPSSERDSLVRAFYKFRTGVVGPKYAAFRYAQDCDDTNDRAFMGSRIKAMTVAGVAATEIATRLHTCIENVETFQKLFFDIADYQGDQVALGAILGPLLMADAPVNQKERIWLLAGLKLGIKGLEYVMDQRVKLTAAEQKEISESIHSILAEQALAYTMSLQFKVEPEKDVLDFYQRSLDSRLHAPPAEDDSKMLIFQQAIGRTLMKRLEGQKAAAEAEAREGSKSPTTVTSLSTG